MFISIDMFSRPTFSHTVEAPTIFEIRIQYKHGLEQSDFTEGLNGVNRQPSNGQKDNLQPSKMENFIACR